MSKKEALIKVLQKIEPYRDFSSGIIALLETVAVDENIINGLLNILNDALKKTKQETGKKKLIQAEQAIRKIKEKEYEEEYGADQELERMISKI